MSNLKIETGATLLGKTYKSNVTVSADGVTQKDPEVPAAKVGQLTTRTDNDTGVVTMTGGHGFITGDKIDLYWSGGSRVRMAATVAVNAVTLDGGSGDVLPANLTAVTAMKARVEDFVVTGDNVVGITANFPTQGSIVFANSDDSFTYPVRTDDAGAWIWYTGSGVTNPLAGESITKVYFSHADATSSQTITVAALFD